jgi:transposase-like protein
MSDVEIITNGGRRRRWPAAEKLRIVEETLDEWASILVVARRNGVAPNLLTRWRRLMLERRAVVYSAGEGFSKLSQSTVKPQQFLALKTTA